MEFTKRLLGILCCTSLGQRGRILLCNCAVVPAGPCSHEVEMRQRHDGGMLALTSACQQHCMDEFVEILLRLPGIQSCMRLGKGTIQLYTRAEGFCLWGIVALLWQLDVGMRLWDGDSGLYSIANTAWMNLLRIWLNSELHEF